MVLYISRIAELTRSTSIRLNSGIHILVTKGESHISVPALEIADQVQRVGLPGACGPLS